MASNSKGNEESNVLFNGVKSILRRRSTPWVGTMTDLGLELNNKFSLTSNWPSTPSSLRVVLNTVVNRLRNAGVSVKFTRTTDRARTRLVKFSYNH